MSGSFSRHIHWRFADTGMNQIAHNVNADKQDQYYSKPNLPSATHKLANCLRCLALWMCHTPISL